MVDQIVVEKNKSQSKPFNWTGVGLLFSIFGLVLFFGAFAYGYFELSKVNVSLARTVSDLQTKINTHQAEVAALQKSMTVLEQTAQQSQALTVQQAALIADWQAAQKGDLEKWYVAEAQYLVKLAQDHLQFSYDTAMALLLLQSAEQILQKSQDSRVLALRKTLATDIASLQAAPAVDITALYLRLSALNVLIDQLPLPANPLNAVAPQPSTTVPNATLPWWRAGLEKSWQVLQKIVIVRNTTTTALPLILPEEKLFLYQNLHAQCEGAMWSVLHRNATVFQNNLARMMVWIQQYFDSQNSATKSMLDSLTVLQNINIQPSTIRLDTTLQQFEQYFRQPGTSTA